MVTLTDPQSRTFKHQRSSSRRMLNLVRQGLSVNRPALVLTAAYIVLGQVLGWIWGFPIDLHIYGYDILVFVPGTLVPILAALCLITLLRDRPENPTRHLWTKLVTEWGVPERIAYGLPVMLIMPFFFSNFTSLKSAISDIVPFYADPYAIQIDRMIHGMDPWRLLQPLLGSHVITLGLNIFYNLWFFVVYATLAITCFTLRDEKLRQQYVCSFLACWIMLGSVLAIALSSVGPCYYQIFFGQPDFEPQMAYLAEASRNYPIWAIRAQASLLEELLNKSAGIGAGISVLPSLHVACAVLTALLCWRLNRALGIAAWLFVATIMAGSVHLAWHYAIDGYLALILVLIIWKLTGVTINRTNSAAMYQTAGR